MEQNRTIYRCFSILWLNESNGFQPRIQIVEARCGGVHIKFALGKHAHGEIFYLQSNQRLVELDGYISISSPLACGGGTPGPYTGWGIETPDVVGMPSRGPVSCLLWGGRLVPLDGLRIRSYKASSANSI